MPHCDVTLQAAAGKAAVGVAPHKGVHTLRVVGAGVGDAFPAGMHRRPAQVHLLLLLCTVPSALDALLACL